MKQLVLLFLFLFMMTVGVPATTAATNNPPRVVQTVPAEIAELPKTGIPLIAWGLAALIPVGFKLRKNGKRTEKKSEEETASSIWLKRELKK